jgi:uncharacterized repeat protein (TIGR01451 family)
VKARVDSARSTLNQHVRLSLALVGLALAVLVMFVPGSRALITPSSPFELDGNVTSTTADDWDRVFANSGGSWFSRTFIGASQEAPANDTTYFTGGGSKDTNDIPQWSWTPTPTPSAPDKDEITDAMAAAYLDSSDNHTLVYFGADRYAVNGDSNIGFWFTQSPIGLNTDGTFSGTHTNGDLFVLSAFGNGGTSPTVTVYDWQDGNLNLLSSGNPCVSSGIACAFVNTSATPMPVPWPYTPKSGTAGNVPQNGFFEGGIDLDALFAANNAPVPCFSSFLAETRSSDSTSATLKDLALGNVNSCGSIELKKHWVGKAGSTTLNIGTAAGTGDVASTPVSGADGTTGPKSEKGGTYYVSETALPNYTTTLACENDKNGGSTPVTPGANNSIPLAAGDQIVCTYTNTYTKASPTLATTLSSSTVAVGSTVHDSASFTGYRSPATGATSTVTYTVYDNNTCTSDANNIDGGTVNVDKSTGHIPDSNGIQFNNAGTYYWQASFSGDDDNNAVKSGCQTEILTVQPKTPGLTTTATTTVAIDGTIHDVAHLSGGFNPTGTISFDVFDDANCAHKVGTVAATQAVTANGDYTSADFTPASAGTYKWIAHYVSGDSNNVSVDTHCGDAGETSTVTPKSPTVATTLSSLVPVSVGSSVHDSATLSGASAHAGGTVTYTVYTNTLCTSGARDAGTVTVTDGNVPDSNTLAFNTAGTFYWQASYSGDTNNVGPVSSGCQTEILTVQPKTPGLTTTATASVSIGGTIHDVAHLTGGFNPTGTISFDVYDDANCAHKVGTVSSLTAVTANGDYTSANFTPASVGTYKWIAHYVSGDGNNNNVNTACGDAGETSTVTPKAPTLTTTATVSVSIGGTIHDVAHLAGGFSPTGTISFDVYSDSNCTHKVGTVAATSAVTANGDYTSADFTPATAGSYYWIAHYVSGDANNGNANTTCGDPNETSTVNPKTPALSTTATGSVTIGGTIHDVAHLTGGFNPTGTISFDVFDDASCAHKVGTVAATSAVTANGDYTSANFTPATAGTYKWIAHYVSGDANNTSVDTACGDTGETSTVNPATPSASTTLHNAGNDASVDNGTHLVLGSSLYDVASLTGVQGVPFGGTVTFNFFKNSACTGDPFATQSGASITGSSATSSTHGPLGAGSYAFNAQYVAGSDPNYTNSAVSSCEPFVIDQAQLAVSTKVEDAQNTEITHGTVGLGSMVHDVSHVTGAVTGFAPAGGVSFVLYSLDNCQGIGQTVTTDGMENGDVRSVDTLPLLPGTYGFIATVTGDDNYLGASGVCEPFTVAPAETTTTTTIHNAAGDADVTDEQVPLGTSVYDSASVTSDNSTAKPTGTVSFKFFSNENCTGEVSQNAGTVALNGNGVASPSNTEGPLAAGSYSFQATYVSGDANFVGSTGQCEPLRVSKGTPTTATTLHNASGDAVVANGSHLPFGSKLYDVATLSNGTGFPFTGTVTFNFFTNSANSESPCSGTPVTQTGATINGSTAQSSTSVALNAGSYAFDAQYVAGNDPNHNDSDVSSCEPFTIDKAAPTIATTLSSSEVVIGTSVHDSAKLTGASPNAGGTVTYTVFDNNTCTPNANTQNGGSVTVTNGTVPDSNALVFNTAGDFYWQAAYGGDANNLAATSACTSEHLVVEKPAIAITKTPASQTINSGSAASFTITVTNTGSVTLTNVTVTDPLSTGCAKTIGTLTAGQTSTYTCSQANVTAGFTNVATVTGHPPVGPDVTASASAVVLVTPPPPPPGPTPTPTPTPTVDLAIVKTATPTSLLKGGNVTYTLTVKNNGPVTDTAVQVADSLPAGVTFVSVTPSQGTCTGGNLVQCTIGSMTNGQSVTISIVVNATTVGTIVNTATVVGALPETTLTNNTSSTTITVNAPPVPKPAPKPVFKPPVVKPKPKPVPPACYAVVVAPKTLTVGSKGTLRLRVTAKNKAIAGVKVMVKGPGIFLLSTRTNSAGKVTVKLNPKKPGIVLVKPASYKGCTNPRIGVIGAFTPPVTG